MRVGFDLFGRGQLFEPREGDAVFLELNADVLDAEGLFDQLTFGVQQLGEVSDRDLFERDLNRQACSSVSASSLTGLNPAAARAMMTASMVS